MALDLRVPFGYRFDPTDEELIRCLDWKRIDPNDPMITFIPDIEVNHHEPSEFAGLGTLKGKDSVYFFGLWSDYGKRKRRQVKKVNGNVIGSWEVVSRAPVKIKSSDGTQIGSRTNFIYNFGGPTGWHMEEYCHDGQKSKVSICRVYNKCSQERGTTKSDAKETHSYDLQISHSAAESYNFKAQEEGQHYLCYLCSKWKQYAETFHSMLKDLCNRFHDQDQTLLSSLNPILKRFENEWSLPKNSKRKCEAGPSCIRDTGNNPEDVDYLCPQANNSKGKQEAGPSSERETLHMDSGGEINEGQKDGGPPEETGRENLYEMPPHGNVENLPPGTWVYSEAENLHMWGEWPEDYSLMDDATKMGNFQHEPLGYAPLEAFDALRYVFPDHSDASCSNAAEKYTDNPDTGNCQSANDTRLDTNDVDNPDTGNCQIADDMDDATKTGNCVSSPFFDTLEDLSQLEPLAESEPFGPEFFFDTAEHCFDTENCQIANETVPMDDATKTGNCVSTPFFDTLEDLSQLEPLAESEPFGSEDFFDTDELFDTD